MDPFVIAHWARISNEPTPTFSEGECLRFETCRRVLWLSFSGKEIFQSWQNEGARIEIFEGSSAYKFLLEVVCGLHSPIFGETEIAGQFREFLLKNSDNNSRSMNLFRPWSLFITEDLKAIRHQHLQGLGHNSYGSVLRKWTRGSNQVAVIGTGQLAQEIQPWLPNETIFVSRTPDQALERMDHSRSATVLPPTALVDLPNDAFVIVASPWSCDQLIAIEQEAQALGKSFQWVDLRAERPNFKAQQTLDQIFAEQDEHKDMKAVSQQALGNELMRRSLKRWNHVHHRPYGWEDLTS